jgi:oligoribonuclease NrnB/cAMP/cGMP phosphodiesterase (DHH superfamily)
MTVSSRQIFPRREGRCAGDPMYDFGNSTKPLVIYHAGCPDGFCAAWIFNMAMKTAGKTASFEPTSYGDRMPLSDFEDRDVWILDFSFPKDFTLRILNCAKSVHIFDHHKTAEADLTSIKHDKLHCVFDMNKSGSRLIWDFLFGTAYCKPWILDYVEDRDLWKHKLPYSHEINAAIASYDRKFDTWSDLNSHKDGDLMCEGIAILRYKKQLIKQAISGAEEMMLDGFPVKVANCSMNLASEVAGEMAEGAPFGAVWCVYKGKKTWSLRSRDGGIDVSEVAKRHGGGGHEHASGFEGEWDAALPRSAQEAATNSSRLL